MLLYQISRPSSYLFIRDRSKYKIDWLLPISVVFLLALVAYFLPIKIEFYGEQGIVSQIQSFIQILPGFYLASLAAIATFNKKDLDCYLPEPTPEIFVTIKGNKISIKLTRRRMLCYLFGYLTFLSIMLYMASLVGFILEPFFRDFKYCISIYILLFSKIAFGIFFFQMLSVTIFGLYQLCDRIHQPDDRC